MRTQRTQRTRALNPSRARTTLRAHTPWFFNHTAVPFDYDPDAPEPKRWLRFLGELWPDATSDQNGKDRVRCVRSPETRGISGSDIACANGAIAALQEWFGYVISGRTDLHKILLLVGPTRAGKGVIARILGELVGAENVAGPTLSSLRVGVRAGAAAGQAVGGDLRRPAERPRSEHRGGAAAVDLRRGPADDQPQVPGADDREVELAADGLLQRAAAAGRRVGGDRWPVCPASYSSGRGWASRIRARVGAAQGVAGDLQLGAGRARSGSRRRGGSPARRVRRRRRWRCRTWRRRWRRSSATAVR